MSPCFAWTPLLFLRILLLYPRTLIASTNRNSCLQTELATAQEEWRACQLVIKEQAATESTLTTQGKALQEDVLSRRDDIIKLLDKVAR